VYRQISINAKLRIGKKRGQKTELTGRTPLKRRRFALDCSTVEDEEEEEEEDDDDDEEEEEEDFRHQLIKIHGVI